MKKLLEHEVQKARAFRITDDEYNRLKILAKSLDITFSDFIREGIKLYTINVIDKLKCRNFCKICNKGFNQKYPGKGSKQLYCSNNCRQKAYINRKIKNN